MHSNTRLAALRTPLPGVPQRPVDLIVIHCSATPSGKPLQQGAPGQVGYLNSASVINAWHAARGFRRGSVARAGFNPSMPSIGYHYVIDLDGAVLSGRHLDEVPAQAAGFNARAVGICLVGGVEREAQYTQAQWSSLTELVVALLAEYGLPAAAPRRVDDAAADVGYRVQGGVCGHRDLSPDTNGDGQIKPPEWVKTCPGFDVQEWLTAGMFPPHQRHVFKGA